MHTAQHLVKNALSGDLAHGRTILLVTHHISLCLPSASYLLELSKGNIIRQGSINELEAQGQLQKFMEQDDSADPARSPSMALKNQADLAGGEEVETKKPRDATNGKLVEAEARAEGRVALSTYWTYIKAAGVISWILILLLMITTRAANILNNVSWRTHTDGRRT